MDINEDNNEELEQNKKEVSNLSLRKPKINQKISNNLFNSQKVFNDLLPGEIELKNEEIFFSHKKRQRDDNTSLINISNEDCSSFTGNNLINDEEKKFSEKALEIFKKLQIPPTPGLKEGDYDTALHNKKEAIVKDILSNENEVNGLRKLACSTRNIDIYCALLDNFNTFSYYNNKFMVNSHYCLDKMVLNAFEFEDKSKTIPLVLKFCNSVFEFGFFEEYHQIYVDFFINLFLDEKKMKFLNEIPRAKIYIYFIIYMIFKDSWQNITIGKEKLRKFINLILLDLTIYDHELTAIIIQLINAICDNIIYPKIFKDEPVDIDACAEINKYMFKLISEIIKNLPPNEKDKIITVESLRFIVKNSFSAVIKIISGLNMINSDNNDLQETLVSKENKQFYFEFIKFFSNFNLEYKIFTWLLDTMAKFAEISYYNDIYLREEMINIIFEKFIVRKNYIEDVFQFMRSLLEGGLFKFFCACDKFYDALNSLDVEKNPYLTSVHFLFMIQQLLEKGEENKCLDNIYDRLCCIQAKEKVEQIYYKFGNEEIIAKKYHEIMPKLDELNKRIQIE